ncbi:hypothetical protein SEF58_13225, partial [Neomoorella humiferrea]|uniref:hypothetical protein n=1 Tax=Neomoorella humiferrea TaxID=676965 RepID=UPI003D8E0470
GQFSLYKAKQSITLLGTHCADPDKYYIVGADGYLRHRLASPAPHNGKAHISPVRASGYQAAFRRFPSLRQFPRLWAAEKSLQAASVLRHLPDGGVTPPTCRPSAPPQGVAGLPGSLAGKSGRLKVDFKMN